MMEACQTLFAKKSSKQQEGKKCRKAHNIPLCIAMCSIPIFGLEFRLISGA